MNKWQDMFDIITEDREITATDGTIFKKRTHYLIYKATGDKYFPPTRPYGYSDLRDAKRGAGKIFNKHMKDIEKSLLLG